MTVNVRGIASAIACTLAVIIPSALGTAFAQQSVQTGDGLLAIKAAMPDEARIGEEFTYEVEVTNNSDNVVLHDIKLRQRKAKGLTIESVSMKGNQDSKQQQDSKAANKSRKDGKKKSPGDSESQQAKNSQQAKDKPEENANASKDQMTISTLQPGDSRVFVVSATADEEGELRSCLEIASYTPALCLTSKVVKPELELTKTAPKKANRCEVIELTYEVKNGGSGDLGKLTVTDSLGEGLATIEGESELSFPVDGLAAGDSRRFVARVFAKKSGEFSSRAVAKADNDDLQSRSKKTTTKVSAADLDARVTGPSRIYGDGLATFTATITNTGNVAAESVDVAVKWPSAANLVDLDNYQLKTSSQKDSSSSQNKKQGQPTLAKKQDSQSQKKNKDQKQSEREKMQLQSESFVIDRLEPGQTAEFTYVVRTDNLEELPTEVQASYVCSIDSVEDQAKAEAKTTATAMATVTVVRLPALQIAVIDAEDPVKNGSKVQYLITVWNEGQAPDQDVQLSAKLPGNLKFDSAEGPTDVENEGDTITFAPIKSMEPGDRAEYTVTAKPTGTGSARFEATLQSKSLKSKVTSEEPTRLFDTASN
ncbi:Large cysteine-rich periplasmic protein omcB precursor [Stieleria neptunia]|uniref:Large cysteine-rich periplasmic protein omcB n=1 Tax=Stieleria neptunia TaxID=2527979 RepID=A0A518HSN4_9BACT|nr:DUF11 domain-containing protein [Stieleria neptunia]QDV43857.1 Large cysteine-rich periplasmic protein omcB precursor [Stieleria neptunia]